ncbi:MAG: hypothetical protein SGPRY_000770 [Prymnesium sp.]
MPGAFTRVTLYFSVASTTPIESFNQTDFLSRAALLLSVNSSDIKLRVEAASLILTISAQYTRADLATATLLALLSELTLADGPHAGTPVRIHLSSGYYPLGSDIRFDANLTASAIFIVSEPPDQASSAVVSARGGIRRASEILSTRKTVLDLGGAHQLTVEGGAPPVHLEGLELRSPLRAAGGELILRDCSLIGVEVGAALVVERNGTASVSHTIFDQNQGTQGGALAISSGYVRMDSSHIRNNTAVRGGGVFVSGGLVFLVNTSCFENTALDRGGCVYNAGGQLFLTDGTLLIRNVAGSDEGGAIFTQAGSVAYVLPAPLGRWITNAAVCDSSTDCDSQPYWRPELVNRTIALISILQDDYPFECSPGHIGNSLEPQMQRTSACSASCSAGYYCDGGTIQPSECKAGEYCPEGSARPNPCPKGTYSNLSRLSSESQCKDCPPGNYCIRGTSQPIPCQKSTFYSGLRAEKSEDCVSCPLSATTATTGSTSIEQCLCSVNYYNENTNGSLSCQQCPLNVQCDSVGIRVDQLLLERGYWRKSPLSVDIRPCPGALARTSTCLGDPETPCASGLGGVYCKSCGGLNVYYDASTSSCFDCVTTKAAFFSLISTTGIATGSCVLVLAYLLGRRVLLSRALARKLDESSMQTDLFAKRVMAPVLLARIFGLRLMARVQVEPATALRPLTADATSVTTPSLTTIPSITTPPKSADGLRGKSVCPVAAPAEAASRSPSKAISVNTPPLPTTPPMTTNPPKSRERPWSKGKSSVFPVTAADEAAFPPLSEMHEQSTASLSLVRQLSSRSQEAGMMLEEMDTPRSTGFSFPQASVSAYHPSHDDQTTAMGSQDQNTAISCATPRSLSPHASRDSIVLVEAEEEPSSSSVVPLPIRRRRTEPRAACYRVETFTSTPIAHHHERTSPHQRDRIAAPETLNTEAGWPKLNLLRELASVAMRRGHKTLLWGSTRASNRVRRFMKRHPWLKTIPTNCKVIWCAHYVAAAAHQFGAIASHTHASSFYQIASLVPDVYRIRVPDAVRTFLESISIGANIELFTVEVKLSLPLAPNTIHHADSRSAS